MTIYDDISNFENTLTERSKGMFLKERMLFKEMMNDILDPIYRGASPTFTASDDGKDASLVLMARLVNDYEASLRLILMGLGEQAYQTMRDSIETSLLLLLFQFDRKLATRWMIDLKQYTAGNTIAELKKHGVDYPFGEMYSTFSALSHPNMVASLHVVEEVQVGEDQFLRTYHFGGYGNFGFMRLQLKILLTLMMTAIIGALPIPLGSNDPEFTEWWDKVQKWPQRLKDEVGLDVELSREPIDKSVQQKINYRRKVDLFSPEAVAEASKLDETNS